MAKTPARIMRSEARVVDGRHVIVFCGKDSAGRSVEMCIPAEGLEAAFVESAKRLTAAQNQASRATAQEWAQSRHLPAEVCRVATTDDGKVVLTARLGLPDEVSLSFDPDTAREIADSLRNEASRIDPNHHRSH